MEKVKNSAAIGRYDHESCIDFEIPQRKETVRGQSSEIRGVCPHGLVQTSGGGNRAGGHCHQTGREAHDGKYQVAAVRSGAVGGTQGAVGTQQINGKGAYR